MTPLHPGSLRPYEQYYSKVQFVMGRKQFRVALKTTGCCYVIRNKVMLDDEMFERFLERLEQAP